MRRWMFRLAVLTLWFAGLSPGLHAEPGADTEARLTVEFLDVGQGDATLIRTPDGKLALIDAGPSHRIVSLLEERGITRLDLAVVTHHHADHYGGMADVIRRFPPRVFLAGDSAHTTPHYLRLLELVRDRGITAIGPTDSARTIALGSVTLTVFPRAPEDREQENNNSVGMRLQFGEFSVVLPGDAERAERRWWEEHAANLCADGTVLKLAHHGSRNGTDARWLELVRPELAVASLAADNEFGHPHRETLELLSRRGIRLLRTDRDGTVTVESDGVHWSVRGHPAVSPRTARSAGRPDESRAKHEAKRRPGEGKVQVNQATAEELQTIPGIGPTLSRRIIDARPFRSLDDLRRVEGLGRKRLAEIEPFISLD